MSTPSVLISHRAEVPLPSGGMVGRRSLVILYSGREGSSALIQTLGRHTGFYAAAFEHLDKGNVGAHVPDPAARVGEILDGVLTRGEVPGRDNTYGDEPVIGFKWRPFGGADAVAALREHGTNVVFLYRRDALARALSTTLRPAHEQFRVARLPPSERAAAVESLRAERFVADPRAVSDSIAKYHDQKRRLWQLYGRELSTRPLEYEWFADEPLAAVNDVLAFVGLDPFAALPSTRFVRIHNAVAEQCDNIDEIRTDRSVQRELDRYGQLVAAIHGGENSAKRWWDLRRLQRR